MIETEITILINRKSDIDMIKRIIIDAKILSPIYIYEYENHFQLTLTSDYEEWELDSAILACFSGYEFTSELDRGKKEIRLQLSRNQSGLSTDDWGRVIEDPLDDTKYLIKKSNNKPEDFKPRITVMFEDKEVYYYIHTVDGRNRSTGEKGFLLLNNFQSAEYDINTEVLKDRLYKTRLEAFYWGCDKMKEQVHNDFKEYLAKKKKSLREQQKVPRKIIRDFISSCNNSDKEKMLKNIDENIVFETIYNRKITSKFKGIEAFKKYIESPEGNLCGHDFTIRSHWDFKLPIVTINLKYYPILQNNENSVQQYKTISFVLKEDKIIYITEENLFT